MKIQKLLAAVSAAAVLLSCGTLIPQVPADAAETVAFSGIQGLPFDGDPFKGVDVSSVTALEDSGVRFYDAAGREQDIFVTLADAGVNTVRIRIWNDPTASGSGATYGGGANDVRQAVRIAERCAAAGLKLLLDFHYSDFWADPAKQRAPKAWENYSTAQKADAITKFTADTLKTIRDTGAEIAMVQIGNETTTGMCGVHLADGNWSEDKWRELASLWNAGAKAVRSFDRSILIALHFTNPEKASNMAYIAKMLAQTKVDYDVFATSYYPYWHGTLQNLTQVLSDIAASYHKKVLVAETSWAYNYENTDFGGNTISEASQLGDYVSYPVSTAGQTAFLTDLFRAVAAVPDGAGIGVFYWEPAWLGLSGDYQTVSGLWNKYGAGWATDAAQEFDPDAKYAGGSSVENQALFDKNGRPLDSLYVFRNIRGAESGRDPHKGKNLIGNPGFEHDGGWSAQPDGWELHGTAGGHFDVRAEDAHGGGYALHWYSETPFSGSTASTQITVTESGRYRAAVTLQADESTEYEITLSAGSRKETASGRGSGWENWQTPAVEMDLAAGETVRLTVSVSGGAGAFGSVDDCEIILTESPAVTTTAAPVTTTTTTVTETTATETEPVTASLWGDADCSGITDVTDVVLIARYAAEDGEAVISAQGKLNGDVNGDHRLDGSDCADILRRVAKLI